MTLNHEADDLARQELTARLSLIETMIAEGRQKTESWGWTFVLWGLAYSGAIVFANLGAPVAGWTTFGHRALAWPVCMVAAMVVMFIYPVLASRNRPSSPDTTIGRAIYSMWIAMGISMFLILLALGTSGRLDQQLFVAIVASMLGTVNGASSMVLKWRQQGLCALVWWATAVAACFCNLTQCTLLFLAAIFLCQIVFGAYGMIAERKMMAGRPGALHA